MIVSFLVKGLMTVGTTTSRKRVTIGKKYLRVFNECYATEPHHFTVFATAAQQSIGADNQYSSGNNIPINAPPLFQPHNNPRTTPFGAQRATRKPSTTSQLLSKEFPADSSKQSFVECNSKPNQRLVI